MYHPQPFTGDDAAGGEALEYLEIYNEGAETADLSGYAFTDGIEFAFPEGTLLPARSFLLLVADPSAFHSYYSFLGVDLGDVPVLGPWTGWLDNSGESIELQVEGGGRLLRFNYQDQGRWPAEADGTGHSLDLLSPYYDLDEPESWGVSPLLGGNPGEAGLFVIPTFEPIDDALTAEWAKIAFDDAAWTPGIIPVGYDTSGGYPIDTELSDMQGAYRSVYLRMPFQLTDPGQVDSLELGTFIDDGLVAYLNGEEIYRTSTAGGMAGVPLAYDAPCSNMSPEPTEYSSIALPGAEDLLVSGENVLAIHAFNASLTSSDFVAGARLLAQVGPDEETLVAGDAACLYFKGLSEPDAGNGEEPEDTYHHSPGKRFMSDVVINEFLAATEELDEGDWIELYNRGAAPVEIGGMWISDDADHLMGDPGAQFQIPEGSVLQPGAFVVFTRADLGFGFSSLGEKIFLTAADGSRVLNAVSYSVQEEIGFSYGRFPDGTEKWYTIPEPSPDSQNSVYLEDAIVINEIMYHPITEQSEDEYIELYNRGGETVSLDGWSLSKAVSFDFPPGTEMQPGEYLVIANDPANISTKYGLPDVLGPYSGALANDGENLRLRDALENAVDEVRYYDGGDWPKAADGDGSSLELVDVRDDNSLAISWAASDESQKAAWTPFTVSAVQTRWWTGPESEIHLGLMHRGEALVDDLSVEQSGVQKLSNGGFESGATGWKIEGTHIDSFVTTEEAYEGNRSLHIKTSGRLDTYNNKIEHELSALQTGQQVTVRGQVRWLSGFPWFHVRTHAAGVAKAIRLSIPEQLGTPGAPNSRMADNRIPAVFNIRQKPVVPSPGEAVTVTADVSDIDGVDLVRLRYRRDGTTTFQVVNMVETVPGSGTYTGQIPGQSANTLMAFYVEALDGQGVSGSYPVEPGEWQCLYYVTEPKYSNFPVYRILFPQATISEITSRPRMSNHLLPCAFVFDETQIFYQCAMRFRGSPFIRGQANPVSSKRAMRIRFSPQKPFLGRQEINLDTMEPSRNPELQSERVAYWIFRKSGVPWSETQFVRVLANGTDHALYGDAQKVDDEYLSFWFAGDDDGYLYKIDDWFEFNDSDGFQNRDADLYPWAPGSWGEVKELFRNNYRPRSREEDDEFGPIAGMIDALNTPGPGEYRTAVRQAMDLDEVLREIAIRHIVGDWDSWGYRRGKNSLIYQRPSDGRMVLIPWDIDFVLGSGDGPTSSLTSATLYGFSRFFQEFGGEYQDVLEDIARKALVSDALDGYLDRTYELFQLEGVGASSPARIKTFLNARRNFILGPPVAITTNGGAPLITSDPAVMLSGSSPFDAETMFLNGVQQTPEWTSPTSWVLPDAIQFGEHIYQVEFFDADGLSIGSDEISIILNPFVIHSVSEDKSGAEISWYSVPRREYSVYGGDVPDELQLLAQDIESEGADTSYIDPLAIGEDTRFYQVVLQSPVWQPGLKGEYYTGMNFENLSLTRIDQQVDFEWGRGSPAPGMPSDNFSVRWTGGIEIKTEGNYTFWTTSDDGVRLKVDDATVIDNWTDHGPTVDGGSRVLSEGFHDLVLEFYENGGGAVIHLEYQGPGIPRQIIPGGTLLHIP